MNDKDHQMNPYLQHLYSSTSGKEVHVKHTSLKGRRERLQNPQTVKQHVELSRKPSEFLFGNYHGYYNYRKENSKSVSGSVADGGASTTRSNHRRRGAEEHLKGGLYDRVDSRIFDFKREWFEGKRVLDIGCNAGLLSLDVARIFNPASLIGVDIDPVLISKARFNLSLARSLAKEKKEGTSFEYYPISCPVLIGSHIPIIQDKKDSSTDLDYENVDCILSNIHFRCGDWVHEPEELVQESFEVILALSITKWIHLNNGDGGIRHFFNRCHQFLCPGGILILEPQNFQGYPKRAGLSRDILDNYNEISFYPKDFLPFLTRNLGFEVLETIHHDSNVNAFLPPSKKSQGFSRQIYILRKN